MHPPLLFLRARRKRRAPCTVEKKKRALVADLGVAVFLPLLRGWLECCAKSAETLVHCSSGRAPRWCGDWEVCGTERVFLQCADCSGVQGVHCGKLALLCFSFHCCCAMRWCSIWKMCSTVRIFLLCADCLSVQRCTAVWLWLWVLFQRFIKRVPLRFVKTGALFLIQISILLPGAGIRARIIS